MKRIVINECYGGFGLSIDALYLLLRLGFPLNSYPLEKSGYTLQDFNLEGPEGIRGMTRGRCLLKDDTVYSFDSGSGRPEDDALRSHPALVKVVEMLGKRAGTDYANLVIEELESDAVYRIEEYDGMESVRPLSTADYTAGHDYVEPALPPDMQIAGEVQMLSGPVKLLS